MSYLVCDKCGGYYELQPGESPDDFTDKCECGGKLRCVQDLNDEDSLQNVCPNCGSLIEEENVVCPDCGFVLKRPHVTEKRVIFVILNSILGISFLSMGAIFGGYVLLAGCIAPFIFNPQSITNYYSQIEVCIVMFLLTCFFLVPAIILSWRLYINYLREYKKDLNWVAIIIAFVLALVMGIYDIGHLGDLFILAPLISGFVAGCIVGKSYTNGLINGGIPASMAGFINMIILIPLVGSEITARSSFGLNLVGTLVVAIPYFMAFFIMGSIGGIIGAGIRKRISG